MDFEMLKDSFELATQQAFDSLVSLNMTEGTWMFLLGVFGTLFCILNLFICMICFPVKRRRMLRKLREKEENERG